MKEFRGRTLAHTPRAICNSKSPAFSDTCSISAGSAGESVDHASAPATTPTTPMRQLLSLGGKFNCRRVPSFYFQGFRGTAGEVAGHTCTSGCVYVQCVYAFAHLPCRQRCAACIKVVHSPHIRESVRKYLLYGWV